MCRSEINNNFICYSKDGLALGWLLKDEGGNAEVRGPNAIPVENAGMATFIKDKISKKPTLFTMATADARVLELSGPFGNAISSTHSSHSPHLSFPSLLFFLFLYSTIKGI